MRLNECLRITWGRRAWSAAKARYCVPLRINQADIIRTKALHVGVKRPVGFIEAIWVPAMNVMCLACIATGCIRDGEMPLLVSRVAHSCDVY